MCGMYFLAIRLLTRVREATFRVYLEVERTKRLEELNDDSLSVQKNLITHKANGPRRFSRSILMARKLARNDGGQQAIK